MPADLVPTVLGQLDTLALAPTIYLALVAVVALAAVTNNTGRRRAAISVLRLLLPRRRPSDQDNPPGPGLSGDP
ncbi:hypothetical protein [Pseudonocardia sp.]|uniref:hypothetical protein n=1 Tax=Pseudonocardia sp. TaxID=60912 RepID=UPI003D0ECC1D